MALRVTVPLAYWFLRMVDEDIDAETPCACHPDTGMLVRADFVGAQIVGVASEDLKTHDIAAFDHSTLVFSRWGHAQKAEKTFTCKDCKDGTDDAFMTLHKICPACGSDWIPF